MRFTYLLLCCVVSLPLLAQDESATIELEMLLGEHEAFKIEKGRAMLADGSGAQVILRGVDSNGTVRVLVGKTALRAKMALLKSISKKDIVAIIALGYQLDGLRPSESPAFLRRSKVLGLHARGADLIVSRWGVLRREAIAKNPSFPRLEEAVEGLDDELKKRGLSEATVQSFTSAIAKLNRKDDNEKHPRPSTLRRMVRSGWGRELLGKRFDRVRSVIVALESFRIRERFALGDISFEIARNTFDETLEILRQPQTLVYHRALPDPAYYPQPVQASILVELTPGADLDGEIEILAARSFVGDDETASWRRDQGLVVNEDLWQRHYRRSAHVRPPLCRDVMPPHLLLISPQGDRLALVIPKGVLKVVDPGQEKDKERFIAEAAALLTTPGQLDLIGEFLFDYVYDSPDPKLPTLVGNKEIHGEIHQTTAETLATATGGVCRGDCDDVAELYETIVEKQGKLAHILDLPAHAALGFAEKLAQEWRVIVLQTGPPLEFRNADLKVALGAAYKHFGAFEAFDPERLQIALRFSGENIRSRWVLGWRIFADPAYATQMIDVQKDWHFHTYQRAFKKMSAMVAAGDDDSANFRELAGLCQRTGQYGLAVDFLKKATKGSDDNSLTLQLSMMSAMHEAGRDEEFAAAARKIMTQRLPKILQEDPFAGIDVACNFVGVILADESLNDMALKALVTHLGPFLGTQLAGLEAAVASGSLNAKFWGDADVAVLKRLMQTYAALAVETLSVWRKQGAKKNLHVFRLMGYIDDYFGGVAFSAARTELELSAVYALLGRYYEVAFGAVPLRKMLDAVSFPTTRLKKPALRGRGALQIQSDLPGIKTSFYWVSVLDELFHSDNEVLDRERLKVLFIRALAAQQACKKLAIPLPPGDPQTHQARLLWALVETDEKALRTLLAHVAGQDDKYLRDLSAVTIGKAARFLEQPWFGQVLRIWHDVVAHKPSAFQLAWLAAEAKAPQAGIQAAEEACRRFPDDLSFAEELKFMKELQSSKD